MRGGLRVAPEHVQNHRKFTLQQWTHGPHRPFRNNHYPSPRRNYELPNAIGNGRSRVRGSGVARAAELSTGATFTSGSNYFICSIVNISTISQTVRIRIYNLNGEVRVDSQNTVLPARATEVWGAFGHGHCRFTTVGAKALFRASISVYEAGNVIASLPAQ